MTDVKGPGILYVTSKMVRQDILNEEAFLKWHSDNYIPAVLQTSRVRPALRLKDVDAAADKPYLALYPMQEVAFTQGEDFKNILVENDVVPGGGSIYDLTDTDVRCYGLLQKYEPNGPTKEGQTKFVATAGVELGDAISEQEFDDWYRQEHLEKISKVPGFILSTRFKLLYSRTHAQSRALKGLPPLDPDLAVEEPPTWLALHEFTDALDTKALMATGATEWSKKILGTAKKLEIPVYRHIQSFGDEKFFH